MPSIAPGLVRWSASDNVISFAVRPVAVTFAATFARPKSRILACPRLVTKIFAGLTSRWTMPSEWGSVECVGDLDGEAENQVCLHRTIADAMLQRHAVEMLHGEKVLTIALVNLEDHADIGMV